MIRIDCIKEYFQEKTSKNKNSFRYNPKVCKAGKREGIWYQPRHSASFTRTSAELVLREAVIQLFCREEYRKLGDTLSSILQDTPFRGLREQVPCEPLEHSTRTGLEFNSMDTNALRHGCSAGVSPSLEGASSCQGKQ